MSNIKLILGDCLTELKKLKPESVNCCITSPPYWGLRNYNVEGQLGLEKTPEEYVAKMVEVFREVKRVLKKEGTLWLNLGDSYAGNREKSGKAGPHATCGNTKAEYCSKFNKIVGDLKSKDLVGIPWKVAFALQSKDYRCEHCGWIGKYAETKQAIDTYCPTCGNRAIDAPGWYLRQDIIWHKPNPMPESVTDRCTKSHEYIFLLAKSQKYYFGNEAIKEPYQNPKEKPRNKSEEGYNQSFSGGRWSKGERDYYAKGGRNKRSVWTVTTKPFKGAHFATFPEDLILPCVLAGCLKGGKILDPFAGAGTTGVVAKKNNRNFIGIELNQEYLAMAQRRIDNTMENLL